LSGHQDSGRPAVRTHAAYLTLPFVSDTQVHADGRILGMALALPGDVTTQDRRQVLRLLAGLRFLTVGGVGRLDLERLSPEQVIHHNLRASTWTGPSRRWASVTPVLLDRFPKRNRETVESVIARGCEWVGFPPPAVLAERHSPLHGVEPSFRYCTRQSRFRLFTHATLTFDREVQGPLLVGAGRYLGLGLFRPLQEGESR
jgi:CRISPR-associated protein Csb2